MKRRHFLQLLSTLPLLGGISGSLNAQKKIEQSASFAGAVGDREKKNIAVFLYNGALILDYGIAAEMFLAANLSKSFNVFTVSGDPSFNLSILGEASPGYLFDDAPMADVVIVPGGMFWPQMAEDPDTIQYLKSAQNNGAILFSICTGSLLLAKAGFLDGRKATTNLRAVNMLITLAPTSKPTDKMNFVDSGNIITAAGAGTAIEATLYLIERLVGKEIADDLKNGYLDYPHDVNQQIH